MNKLNIEACPLCGSKDLERKISCKDFYASGEEFELFGCANCSFLFTQGAPSGSDMDRYYDAPTYISHTDTKKGLMNSMYHWVRRYMLLRKASLVEKASSRSTGRLLDIGTGTGYFPATMAKRGWSVEAVEKNAAARVYAKEHFGLDVQPTNALWRFPAASFDVITLWHVMEHLEDMRTVWAGLFELLTEKGVLIIAVPNAASYDATRYGANWAAYDVPRHLWHFTPATMQQFASRFGGFIMAERHPMPFDAFYVSMLSEKNMGHRCSFLRGMYVGLIAWFHTLAKKERSSSMIYVFRKKTL